MMRAREVGGRRPLTQRLQLLNDNTPFGRPICLILGQHPLDQLAHFLRQRFIDPFQRQRLRADVVIDDGQRRRSGER